MPSQGVSFESALRKLMPGAGLFREDWLRRDQEGLNLNIPRRRDARALGEYFRRELTKAGFTPDLFEWRDISARRGFAMSIGTEKLVALQDKNPGLAFVIDDWGYNLKVLQAMKNFQGRLTIAVLPGLPHSREIAQAALQTGHELILHLPMESESEHAQVEGTLLAGMGREAVAALLERHSSGLPAISGLNNHEGSKASADRALMSTVAAWLRDRGGYFLDSKTSPKSVGEEQAKKAGIPYASRRIFLDNVDTPQAIEAAARQALAIAKKTGSCIAIGHPRENTLAVLGRLAAEIESQGVDLVRASELTFFEIPNHER